MTETQYGYTTPEATPENPNPQPCISSTVTRQGTLGADGTAAFETETITNYYADGFPTDGVTRVLITGEDVSRTTFTYEALPEDHPLAPGGLKQTGITEENEPNGFEQSSRVENILDSEHALVQRTTEIPDTAPGNVGGTLREVESGFNDQGLATQSVTEQIAPGGAVLSTASISATYHPNGQVASADVNLDNQITGLKTATSSSFNEDGLPVAAQTSTFRPGNETDNPDVLTTVGYGEDGLLQHIVTKTDADPAAEGDQFCETETTTTFNRAEGSYTSVVRQDTDSNGIYDQVTDFKGALGSDGQPALDPTTGQPIPFEPVFGGTNVPVEPPVEPPVEAPVEQVPPAAAAGFAQSPTGAQWPDEGHTGFTDHGGDGFYYYDVVLSPSGPPIGGVGAEAFTMNMFNGHIQAKAVNLDDA